ncbi:tRNA 2-thiouridine synthesizing protein C [Marinobacter gudaonensis]|uniref:tRNA 2-thiouridine synthesizing protein C n=1 Tax=Marinobacter gudaonensis TaxID=375760 RepID=A0A1I6GBR6_9GAMM|nr:DsrE family protein [Marinobacter gudaonensis]SFR39626.1 tRNA 2-thiouridine synthesizing protein C [Marinobacter gudaonensis]
MATLIVIDQAPYGSWAGREALDMTFSLAAFDQEAALLFTGPGVNWLRKAQQASEIGQKTVEKNLAAAPVFGIDAIMADRSACASYGLSEASMIPGVTLVESGPDLFRQYDHAAFAG